MESKDGDALSNTSDAPEYDQTLIPTLPQDQESAEDVDGTIKRLRDEIRALLDENGQLELLLDDSRKKLHRAEAESRSLAAEAKHLEEDIAAVACASKDLETEADRLKRAIKDLEADEASPATGKAANEAEISALKEWEDIDLRVEVRDSVEQGEAAVEEQVKITEAREGELQQVVKTLEEANTRLEMQGGHDAAVAPARRRLKVSQVVAALASLGALAALAVAVYLYRGNPKVKRGARVMNS